LRPHSNEGRPLIRCPDGWKQFDSDRSIWMDGWIEMNGVFWEGSEVWTNWIFWGS
jgi:hypothetical protein